MWMLVFDFILSTVWAFSYAISVILWIMGKYMEMPPSLSVPTIWPPAFWGLVLATVSLLQFAVSMVLESRYDYKLVRYMAWTIWYPLFFWALSLFTTLVGLPKAFFARKNRRALWNSPDRGFR